MVRPIIYTNKLFGQHELDDEVATDEAPSYEEQQDSAIHNGNAVDGGQIGWFVSDTLRIDLEKMLQFAIPKKM